MERFSLVSYVVPYLPSATRSYMPQVRLREPTGTKSASLVKIVARMPEAPPTGWCAPWPARVWGPGESRDALGLDWYFGEPEFSFGPYSPSPTVGPVEVILVVADDKGVQGSITLSATMGSADISSSDSLTVQQSFLGCRS